MKPTEPSVVREVRALQRWSDAERAAGRRIALVPTMGSLHEGHLSLCREARGRADRVVASVFVNPTQFGPNDDFERYPRDLAGDVEKLRSVGVDVVFAPAVSEMYPGGEGTWVEVGELGDSLCGRGRPGHFRGVTTVVARLFHAAKPHFAVFGEKDYQQLQIVRRMTRDLLFDVEILGAPTVREPDGLALSSRNAYLRREARLQATALNAALVEARQAVESGERDADRLVRAARRRIEKEPLAKVEYVELTDAESLRPVRALAGRTLLAVAVRFEGTRLIDNVLLEVPA